MSGAKSRKRRTDRRHIERELAKLTDKERAARIRAALQELDQQRKDAQ